MAIRTCRDRRTADFMAGKRVRAFEQCSDAARRAIAKLQGAEQLRDLRNPPSNNFEALRREPGRYSIRIDRKWRLCFSWTPRAPLGAGADILTVDGDADGVEITNHYD